MVLRILIENLKNCGKIIGRMVLKIVGKRALKPVMLQTEGEQFCDMIELCSGAKNARRTVQKIVKEAGIEAMP